MPTVKEIVEGVWSEINSKNLSYKTRGWYKHHLEMIMYYLPRQENSVIPDGLTSEVNEDNLELLLKQYNGSEYLHIKKIISNYIRRSFKQISNKP